MEAFVADSVEIANGKLHVEGTGWNHLFVPALPATSPRLGLAILATIPYELAGVDHSVEIRLEDPSGDSVALGFETADAGSPCDRIEVRFRLDPPFPESPLPEHVMPIAITVDGAQLRRTGVHRFLIAIDRVEATEVPFAVATAAQVDAGGVGDTREDDGC